MVESVASCIRSGWWGAGPMCDRVETEIRKLTGSAHCVMVASGSAALHAALFSAKIGPGDEVITTPLTYAATANAIEMVGAKTVFADIDERTGNIDPAAVAAAVGPRTVAILPVHLAGRPCDMDALLCIAGQKGLLVLEDAAHAIGARSRGRHAGTHGFAGVFSFNYSKNVAAPEAGALITDSENIARAARSFSHCGEEKTTWERFKERSLAAIVSKGVNYRPTDLAAAMLLPQLARLDLILLGRARVWRTYDEAFEDSPFGLPEAVPPGMTHAMHLYQIRLPDGVDRDSFRQAMGAWGVGTGVHYRPLHLEPYYREKYGQKEGSFRSAEAFGRKTVSLPLSPKLSDADIRRVIQAARSALGKY